MSNTKLFEQLTGDELLPMFRKGQPRPRHVAAAYDTLTSLRFHHDVQAAFTRWPDAAAFLCDGPYNPVPWAGRLACAHRAEATITETTEAYIELLEPWQRSQADRLARHAIALAFTTAQLDMWTADGV